MNDVLVVKPPRRWELQTTALVVLVAVAAAAGTAMTALYFVLGGAITDGTTGDLPGWVLSVVRHAHVVDLVYLGTILVYLGAFFWWRNETRTILMIFAGGNLRPLNNGTLKLWNAFVIMAFMVRFLGNRDTPETITEWSSHLQMSGLGSALRVLALLCLLLGVWQIRNRVRDTVAFAASQPATQPNN